MSPPHRTGLNLAIVSVASLVQIANQFLFLKLNAYLFGVTDATDSLFYALTLASAVAAMLSGAISYVLIPDLVAKFEQGEDRSGWGLATFAALVTLSISGVTSAMTAWYALPVCRLLHAEAYPGQYVQEAGFLQVLCIQIVLLGMISWAQAVLHSRHQFFWAASGGVVGTALQLLLLLAIGGQDVGAIAWAIVFGSAISLALHLIPIVRHLRLPIVDAANLWRLFGATWPLLLGSLFQRVEPLFSQTWASTLDEGTRSHLHYSTRILTALLTLGTSSLSLVAFPQLAGRFANEGPEGFGDHFSLCARRMALIIVPILIGVSVFAPWIVGDLLADGQYSEEDAATLAQLVVLMMGLFLGASIAEIVSRGFYVLGDTRTPTVIGVICLALCLVIRYYLFRWGGVEGLAIGISIYFVVTAAVLTFALRRRINVPILSGLTSPLIQSVIAATVACLVCYLVYRFGLGTWAAGPVGVLVYSIGLLCMKNEDALRAYRAAVLRVGLLTRRAG
ncbi:MAG: murein biosynthesis integral membrane protein MurJ [Aureliella sp.]